ncbi:olfactory receptor 5AR1-like [Leptodactylus fuscus]|uniref:olfactory receptor 5AR1-like n=1 Tax=Leptodactylus fuscus TaxID=238119 RepID=UPI003F4E9570
METANKTHIDMFLFSGITDGVILAPILFVFFLMVYLVTLVGNIGMVVLVLQTSKLHTPMYFFLCFLSMVDLTCSSVITPNMLVDLLSIKKTISFIGCALQFFFFAAMAATEAILLSSMSYDRYVAICHPLHYIFIMTKKKCWCLVLFSFTVGFLQSLAQTSCMFSLEFCGSNHIEHFYCDVSPLLRLSCSDTFTCNMVTIFIISTCSIGSFLTILVSYIFIVYSILHMKSAEGRRKAFTTCSAHLTSVFILFGSVFFVYLRSPTSDFGKRDKVASVFYTVMMPMLNPLIYSVRNQEVKKVLMVVVERTGKLVNWKKTTHPHSTLHIQPLTSNG